jgi:hypothetical protein
MGRQPWIWAGLVDGTPQSHVMRVRPERRLGHAGENLSSSRRMLLQKLLHLSKKAVLGKRLLEEGGRAAG